MLDLKKPSATLMTSAPVAETLEKELVAELSELNERVGKQNSWGHLFLRGILLGVGTAIGATVVVGLLGSALWYLLSAFGVATPLEPYLEPLMRRTNW